MESNTTPIVPASNTATPGPRRDAVRALRSVGVTMEEMPAWPDWLRKPKSHPHGEEKLLGVPVIRRVKNYAAFSGYVYEYLFEGYRDQQQAREFVFSITGDRKAWCTFEVRLGDSATEAWERERARTLGDRERYALAKLALFSVLDERENPAQVRGAFEITPEMATELIEKLDL